MGIVSDIKNKATQGLQATTDFSINKLHALREEAGEVNEVLKSFSPIFRKSETIAILVKKLGDSDGFQQALDKITRDGYVFMFKEEVRDIPLPSGFKLPLGSMYYFQHAKFRFPDNFSSK